MRGVFGAIAVIGTVLLVGVTGCSTAPEPDESITGLPTTRTTGTGWQIPELIAATVDDAMPDRLLAVRYDRATDQRSTYLIDRGTGSVLWRRSGVTECFFETSARIWCRPMAPGAGAPEAGRMIIDGNTVTRLSAGEDTEARAAAARNRGDVERPATVTTVRNEVGAYCCTPRHDVLVRRRSNNKTVATFDVSGDNDSYAATGTSFPGGFAFSILASDEPVYLELYDEKGENERRVDGLRVPDHNCELPIFATGAVSDPRSRTVLVDPRDGRTLYTFRGPPTACGTDFAVDGTRFVDVASGRTVNLNIPQPSERQTYTFAADKTKIVAVSQDAMTVFDRATGRVVVASTPLPRGGQPEYADSHSVVVSSVDGLDAIRF